MKSYIEKLNVNHPVKVYFEEKKIIEEIITELENTEVETDFQKYFNLFNQLSEIDKRFTRKENQLFPYLEKYGWNGPSQVMWSFHDNLRDQIRLLKKYNEEKNIAKINQNLVFLIDGIRRLMTTEELKLFPTSLELLTQEDWEEMEKGEEEIGWMHKKAVSETKEGGYIHPSQDFTKRDVSFSTENTYHYDEGYMTPEQVNLLLKTMPVDLTYVDENDKVIFYNRGEERVFPRSAGIIGREVKFCHPPKSVGTVLKIVEEFRQGTQHTADFWINFKERLILIRYFAVRDENKKYRGVIEMSQDITDIQKLEGEQRLLDWK
ncbi:MAG: PAS domain-containing protein [Flavobacteriales bacterium]